MFRWVALEPRCVLVIKNLLRAATLASYSIFFTPICFIFLGLMMQSRALLGNNTVNFYIFRLVVDELDIMRKRLERLANVQEIDLSFQGISILDRLGMEPWDRAFRSLCKLDLSHNILHKLPESIGSLLSLTHLFLNDNCLSSLQPEIIRRLVNLQELDLRNNKLNNFSLDITELSCLRRLSVQGNPLKDDETRKLMKLANNERWIDIAGECKIL